MRHNGDLLKENSGFTPDLFKDVRTWFLISNPIVKLLEPSEIVVGMLVELSTFCHQHFGSSSLKNESLDRDVFSILESYFTIG